MIFLNQDKLNILHTQLARVIKIKDQILRQAANGVNIDNPYAALEKPFFKFKKALIQLNNRACDAKLALVSRNFAIMPTFQLPQIYDPLIHQVDSPYVLVDTADLVSELDRTYEDFVNENYDYIIPPDVIESIVYWTENYSIDLYLGESYDNCSQVLDFINKIQAGDFNQNIDAVAGQLNSLNLNFDVSIYHLGEASNIFAFPLGTTGIF